MKSKTEMIQELEIELKKETDLDERQNIIRTINELRNDAPLELPTMDVDQWETLLKEYD